MKEGRKPEYPEKTPGDELQKMPHTTTRRFKPQARLEPVQCLRFVGWLLNIPATWYSVSAGQMCSGNCPSCHTETEVADQTCRLVQSQYTDTRFTGPSADPIAPGAWQGSHWSTDFEVTGMTRAVCLFVGWLLNVPATG